MASVQTISTEKQYPTIEQPTPFWTTAKIQQTALSVLATLSAAGTIPLILLTPTPYALLSIPLALISLGSAHTAYYLKDYENPQKLAFYRQEAPHLTFKELYSAHGLQNLLQYEILPLSTLQEKFYRQIQAMGFTSVLDSFDLDTLTSHQIISSGHAILLRSLQQQSKAARANYNAEAIQCDLRHRNRSDVLKRRVREAHLVANAAAAGAACPHERTDAYFRTNAISAPIALVGEIIVDNVGKAEQTSYELEIASARQKYGSRMISLESTYTHFKKSL
jgi:hypothetical protein